MQLFLVVFEDQIPNDVVERAKESGLVRETYNVTPNVLLAQSVAHDPKIVGSLMEVEEEAAAPTRRVGVVFRLNGSYSGYYYPEIWRWLEERRGEPELA